MNINEKDIIVLDDNNHYIVVKKIDYNSKKYYYISDINNKENMKYLYEDGNELVEIEDEKELENVIIKMYETIDMDDLLRELKEQLEEQNNDSSIN
ncbi:MAG: hypothetical protein J6B98_05340 [Bacilli bacterium]|nr:hypothetical protein [Bacilli bacterium]